MIWIISRGPKARSIPAWGNAPGRETITRLRAEGPIHTDGETDWKDRGIIDMFPHVRFVRDICSNQGKMPALHRADAVQSRARERAGELAELPYATLSPTVAALYDLAAGAPCFQGLNRSPGWRFGVQSHVYVIILKICPLS